MRKSKCNYVTRQVFPKKVWVKSSRAKGAVPTSTRSLPPKAFDSRKRETFASETGADPDGPVRTSGLTMQTACQSPDSFVKSVRDVSPEERINFLLNDASDSKVGKQFANFPPLLPLLPPLPLIIGYCGLLSKGWWKTKKKNTSQDQSETAFCLDLEPWKGKSGSETGKIRKGLFNESVKFTR